MTKFKKIKKIWIGNNFSGKLVSSKFLLESNDPLPPTSESVIKT